jgi:2-polyprenyl-3-methyl-5-hydroxy-6-metoxy-1,4-benzoquinol methylase
MTEPDCFRERVRAIWREVPAPGQGFERTPDERFAYANMEGGSVEQQRDKRLLLHHCANYAAVLALLSPTGQTSRRGLGHDPKSPADSGHVPSLRLVELGCGSGVLSSAFARVMPPGWQLVATDYSEQLLAGAGRRVLAPNLRFEHLDLRTADKSRLADADAVFMLEVIEHLPSPEAGDLLTRLHEALRPGARLVLSTLDRSPFLRPFSGYAPHFVEYDCRALGEFLRKSPFERCSLFRLVSPMIAGEAVRSEERGGYVLNRLQRLLLGLGSRHPEFGALRKGLESALFCLYTLLPTTGEFDFEGYLGTLDLVQAGPEVRERDSFGLVALMEKA